MRWLLTRELDDGERERFELERRGLCVVSAPCILFVARPWPAWEAQPGEPLMFLTSRRAAREYVRAGQRGGLVAAMAPATTEELERAGHRVDITARGGAAALADAVLAAWDARGRPTWHLRYPTSDVALGAAEQATAMATLARVGPVQRAVVCETTAPAGLAASLAGAVTPPWSVCFHSPSAVATFLRAAPPSAGPPVHAVCFGRSTRDAWDAQRPSGWPAAHHTASVVETIAALEESAP